MIGCRCRQHGLEGQGCGNFGVADQFFAAIHGQAPDSRHKGRAINQGISLLGDQLEARDTGFAHGLVPAHQLACIPGFAAVAFAVCIAGGHNGNGSQGNQVTAGSQGALFRYIRGDALVEHFDESFHHHGANSGWSAGDGVGPDDHHGPDDLFGQWFADTSHIGQDNVPGKLAGLVRIDGFIGVGAESGIDAVEYGILFLNCLAQPLLGGGHARFCFLVEQIHLCQVVGHRVDFFDGQLFSGYVNCCHEYRPLKQCRY